MTKDKERELFSRAERLVSQEVLCCQSMTMLFIQDHDQDFFFSEMENLARPVCPHCEESVAVEGEDYTPGAFGDGFVCLHCNESFNEPELKDAEVYEWWAVTNWLADKLQERGEVMFDGPDCKIWGRQTTGQAIALDYVIQRIVEDTYR